jgi:two-component system response regulator HydG
LFSEYFLSEANKGLNKEVLGLSKEVEIAFKKYHWPGNLRELKNVIKRSVLLAQKPLISLDVIPREVLNSQEARVPQKDFSRHSNEKQLIINALRETNYNKSRAAKLLEITRKTLYNKMAQYQIER